MTIRPGQDWGTADPLPRGNPVVTEDRQLADIVAAAHAAGEDIPVVGLAGGDLARTMGGPRPVDVLVSTGTRLAVDIGTVRLDDGEQEYFAAHVLARRRGWRGRVVAVMNAEWMGHWDVAPRSHPGDGRIEVVDARLAVPDRLKAWRRLRHGRHLPHPDIQVSRIASATIALDRPTGVWLDGRPVGTARRLDVGVQCGVASVVV